MGKFHQLFSLNKKAMDLAGVAISLKRMTYFLKNKQDAKRNEELRTYKKSDTCYIIGLGPSLRHVDLSKIDGDSMVVNGFYNVSDAKNFKPTYYCITDDAAYSEAENNMLKSAVSAFPETTFILNGKYRAAAEEKIAGLDASRYYAYAWGGFFNPNREVDFTKVLPIMGNIVCFAVMAAFYLGYKKIVLLGCDFNSFAFRKQAHCYEDEDNARSMRLSYELFCYSFCADTHDLLYLYAKAHGIEVINATDGSLIDAYPYDEAAVRYFLKD